MIAHASLSRRSFLKAGTLSLLGSGLGGCVRWGLLARAAAASRTDKACILILLTGGPAHQETFDPKPDAPELFFPRPPESYAARSSNFSASSRNL